MNYPEIKRKLSEVSAKGEIKKLAKEIKKNHQLSMMLLDEKDYNSALLAVLVADKSLINEKYVTELSTKIDHLAYDEQNYVSDWLLANQLTKSKQSILMMSKWQDNESDFKRRLFWYYQARLRWTGKTDFDNTEELVALIEQRLATEKENVQWAMNFCAAWIAIHDQTFRSKISKIGEKVGLYKEEKVPKKCTPNYLPEFIKTEVNKQKNRRT